MEWISGNVFIRSNRLEKAGSVTPGHTHNFDHTTIVFSGAIRVAAYKPLWDENEKQWVRGELIAIREYGEGQPHGRHCLIKADVFHVITALVDHTEYWCVYSHRDPQGEVSQVQTGWRDAYV